MTSGFPPIKIDIRTMTRPRLIRMMGGMAARVALAFHVTDCHCLECDWLTRAAQELNDNPACPACNGTGCEACDYTGWE